jgi:hypothetical protein
VRLDMAAPARVVDEDLRTAASLIGEGDHSLHVIVV